MKRVRARWLLLVALAAFSCTDDEPSGITVTVQKLDPAQQCYATITGDPLPFQPDDVCEAAGSTELVAGVDTIRLVIGYGDLEFAASSKRPPPTIAITLDGVATPSSVDIVPARLDKPTAFFATFDAPSREVSGMYIDVNVGEGFAHPAIGPLRVAAPAVDISVENCDARNDCVLHGGGKVAVHVRAPGTTATTGTVSWTLNGVRQESSTSVELVPAPDDRRHVAGLAFVPIPVVAEESSWVLKAAVGTSSKAARAITLQPALPAAKIHECGDAGTCQLVAAVGTAAVEVTVPGTSATMGSISTSLDGIPQPGAIPFELTPAANATDMLSGIAFLPVPAARDSGQWRLSARVGAAGRIVVPDITLRAPVITATIGTCTGTAACTLQAGQEVPLIITAPRRIQAPQATVIATLDGGPQSTPTILTLDREDLDTNTVSATQNVKVPAQPQSTWTVNSSVLGYKANSLVVSIVP